MLRLSSAVLVLFLAASSVPLSATSGRKVGVSADEGSQSLAAVNRVLSGRRANIVLKNGEVIIGARNVGVGPVSTVWKIGGERRLAATDEVQRISLGKGARIKRWAGRGLIAGAVLGSVAIIDSSIDGTSIELADPEDIVKSAALGAAVGAAAATVAGRRVVFEAADD